MTETFRSKVDGWFMLTATVVVAVGVAGAVAAATAGTYLLPALVTVPSVALVLWIWRSTRYMVSDTALLVRCAFINIAVPLADITAVRRTSSVLSAPALSLDRLEVQHTGGAVAISPAEREKFVAAITARNPRVNVEGVHARSADADAAFRRQRRALGLALAGVVAVVAALMTAFNVFELPPPRVTVADSGIVVVSGSTRMVVSPGAITSLTLEERLPRLRKRFGWNTFTSLRGRFNTDRAAGWVHVSRRRPPFIVLETADSFMILNDSDPEKTRAAYEAMAQRWRMSRQ